VILKDVIVAWTGDTGIPGRIGEMDDEITRVPRHHHRLHWSLAAFTGPGHSVETDEMVIHTSAATETGEAGL